jgi:hypothetical protein
MVIVFDNGFQRKVIALFVEQMHDLIDLDYKIKVSI